MKVFDTNMILRYLLRDNEEMAHKVIDILNSEKVLVLPEVLAEAVYVMKSVYECDRETISDVLSDFISLDSIITDHTDALLKCMELYKETKLDFVDCLLAAYHLTIDYDVYSFDQKLNKLIKRKDDEKAASGNE